LLALDAGASLLLDPWLELTAHCPAEVEFELFEPDGGDPTRTERAAAERVIEAGRGVSLAPIDGVGLLTALGARWRHHPRGELPAAFTDPFGELGLERGSAAAGRVRVALGPVARAARDAAAPDDAGLGVAVTSTARAAAVVEAAFAHAATIGAARVTVVHRASAAPTTDGLFLLAARNVAVRHTRVGFEDLSFDELARRAVRDRASLEVLAGPPAAVDAALGVLAAVAGVTPPCGYVLGRGAARLLGRHGAPGGLAALLRVAIALYDDLGEDDCARRLERAVGEASLHADYTRNPAELVAARLALD
jgi:hypothetical protein